MLTTRPIALVSPAGPVVLLAAASDDFEALLALRIAAMRESLAHLGRFDPDRARARFQSSFSAAHTWHIEAGGQRVGFLAVKPLGDDLLLDHFYLHPDGQRQGIGAAVLGQVLDEARVAGRSVRVTALRGSASNRFYERHGFVRVDQGEFDNHYLWTGERGR